MEQALPRGKFVGKTMLGKLDDELRVKLQFISTHISKHYDAIQMSIINRTDGVIDKQTMLFGDIIGQKTLHGTPNVNPYMWEDNNKGMWYTPVSLSEKAHIADSSRESAFDHQLYLRILRVLAVSR